jgi:hypothetical protein
MRRAARVDRNQPEIVQALRDAGASVTPLHMVGKGFPDLAVGRAGMTFLLEVKDGNKPPSRRRLTADEEAFFNSWRGHAAVVESVDDALRAVGLGE